MAKNSIVILTVLVTSCALAQSEPLKVEVAVDAAKSSAASPPVWNFFGYDEPNYTYAANGRKLLHEIAGLSQAPAYIRVHNLLTSGDESASLKWGSTNVYSEDASGHPVYNWAILDRIFDTFRETGVKPLVEIGFMPEALSTHPQPYRHNFPNGSIYTGWAYPPNDYKKWADVVFNFVEHLRTRYGDDEVRTWLWEVWNEPDIEYWKGSEEEYFKLYDYSADAVLRALPNATIGGPDTTGPGRPKAVEFISDFLKHCDTGKNYATGKTGTPLDFISFHPKGSPSWQGDHVQMGLAAQLKAINQGFKTVASFARWKQTPIILGEWDPEGCAACSAEKNPQNGYRNGPLYAAYTAEALSQTMALAKRDGINLKGVVTWAFEFENQPYFAGYRELASNGLDKPVLNTFRMLGLMRGDAVQVNSSGALDTHRVLQDGVRAAPDIRAIAARGEREITVLIWNYHDDDLAALPAAIELRIASLSPDIKRGLVEHFRIDADHSNSFAAWRGMGSLQNPTEKQYKELEAAGQLQLLTSSQWIWIAGGKARLNFDLPRQGLSLVRISW